MVTCFVCHSNAPYGCMRCDRDVCDQHAIFLEDG
jgi:hypothetical protein